MLARHNSPIVLSAADGRHLWLAAQRLDARAPFDSGPEAVEAAIRHLGYVQIDTINVIERCHHHILFSRIPNYRRSDLHHVQNVARSVFEYWTHALSYVHAADFRFFARAMREDWKSSKHFAQVDAAELRKLIRRIERNGPLSIRDVDEETVEKTHLWASRKPSKRMLELAFYQGVLVISRRSGMVKTYELTKRHFGWDRLPSPAAETDILDYRLDRALRAQGLVSLESICHLEPSRKPAMRRRIEARMRRKQLVAVAVEGAGKQVHWATPEALEMASKPEADLVHILSPFDPLIIQRKRLKLFFGYDHLFEAYVPKEKRRLGYFALPVLIGDEIVAAIDIKTDRSAGKLRIQQWTWVGNGSEAAHQRLIDEELHRFEAFQLGR
jgi:uncharacterized protein